MAMRFTLPVLLLVCIVCLLWRTEVIAAEDPLLNDSFANRTLAVIEDLFEGKGLSPDKLAGTVVDALLRSRKQNARLVEFIIGELFNNCQVATRIVDTLERSSKQLNRLHELLNSFAAGL